MGFWDAISNALNRTANDIQEAEDEARKELEWLSDRQLEDKIRNSGSSLKAIKKKCVYVNEYERRKAEKQSK